MSIYPKYYVLEAIQELYSNVRPLSLLTQPWLFPFCLVCFWWNINFHKSTLHLTNCIWDVHQFWSSLNLYRSQLYRHATKLLFIIFKCSELWSQKQIKCAAINWKKTFENFSAVALSFIRFPTVRTFDVCCFYVFYQRQW